MPVAEARRDPVPEPDRTTIVHALRSRALARPEALAFGFLRRRGSGELDTDRLSYDELLRRGLAVAAVLLQRGDRGDRVLILAPPGFDYIAGLFGCFLAGRVAVPAYPPRNAKNMARLSAVAEDCGATVLLTSTDVAGKVGEWGAGRLPPLLLLDDLPAAPPALPVDPSPDELVLLQYTSGTTGLPRGVMVSHANLVATIAAAEAKFGLSPADRLVAWLPPYHDFGLVGALLQAVFSGFTSFLLTPAAFLQDPVVWLQAIALHRATLTLGPNFGYELLCRVRLDEPAGLNLSSLRAAAMGGEPPRAATMERFARRFAPAGFRGTILCPGYGLAEATLNVTAVPPPPAAAAAALVGDVARRAWPPTLSQEQHGSRAVSNGPPFPGMTVRIVDPATRMEVAHGAVGEIWVAGSAVTRGYWRRPELTQATFDARLADAPEAGPFLRSGDLGTLVDGELYVLGRIKELLILRGQNLYPQDVEATVQASDPRLAPDGTIAFTVEGGQEERLVIVHELARSAQRGLDTEALLASMRRAVVEAHGVDPHTVVLIRQPTLPRTTSGKLQRLRAREQFLAGELSEIARWQQEDAAAAPPVLDPATAGLERLVCELAEQVTGARGIRPEDSFFDLGGDSLAAMRFVDLLERRTGIALPLRELYELPTPAALARRLAASAAAVPAAIPPDEAGLAVPLAPLPEAGRDGRPLVFCFHGAMGMAADHVALGLLLPDYRLIAVQARGLLPDRLPETDLRALVTTYAGLVARLAPNGPYRFVGTGTGAGVALEVLRQLRPEPSPLDFLAIVDADPTPVEWELLPRSFEACALRSWLGLSPGRARLLAALARALPWRWRQAAFVQAMRRQLADAPRLPGLPDPTPGWVAGMRRTTETQLAMFREQWRPAPHPVRALLITAAADSAAGARVERAWRTLLPSMRRADVVGARSAIGSPMPQREIAALLRAAFDKQAGAADAGYNPLLPLQPGGALPPLFCVHPLIGRALIFRPLAEALRPDVPVWGLETRGGEPGETPFGSLAELVAAYLAAIRTVQPRGPYHLAGHSLGGSIAQELACRLEQAGESVRFVAMFDTPLPAHFPTDRLPERRDTVRALAKTVDLPQHEIADTGEAGVARLVERLIGQGFVPRGTDSDWLAQRIDAGTRTGVALVEHCTRYEPQVCAAPIILFRAVEETEFPGDEAFDWRPYTRGGMVRIDLAANHNRILEPVHAARAAAVLRDRIGRHDVAPAGPA